MYETHLAIQRHPLVSSAFGGLAGYKLGAIGAEGETCLYAPLFKSFLVEAPGGELSASAYNLWQIEPEVGIFMGAGLPPRDDGAPHSVDAVWAAAAEVVLCIECCGKRRTPEAVISGLASYADTLSSGGVVLGPRLPAASVSHDALRGATVLLVNDEVAAEGSGAATPLGGPAEALTWLANHLNGRGLALEKGHFVATGQTCNTKACKPGDRVTATYASLAGLGASNIVEMQIAP